MIEHTAARAARFHDHCTGMSAALSAVAAARLRQLRRAALVSAMLPFTVAPCAALAQDAPDAGLVNQVAGEVSYASEGAQPRRAQSFMKVRQGDRFTVPAGAMVRVVYFAGGRQETWKGPAVFVVGPNASRASAGSAEVAVLPGAVPVKMAKLPEMVQAARLGGVTVRGAVPRVVPTAEEQAELASARDIYRRLRGSAPEDDLTPELYLLTVLQEHGRYEEMAALLEAMARRQPLGPELQELAAWVKTRSP